MHCNGAKGNAARGWVLHTLQRYEEALAAYEQAIRLDPENVLAYLNKGYALASLTRDEEALAVYEQAIALAPGNSIAWRNSGDAECAIVHPLPQQGTFNLNKRHVLQ